MQVVSLGQARKQGDVSHADRPATAVQAPARRFKRGYMRMPFVASYCAWDLCAFLRLLIAVGTLRLQLGELTFVLRALLQAKAYLPFGSWAPALIQTGLLAKIPNNHGLTKSNYHIISLHSMAAARSLKKTAS